MKKCLILLVFFTIFLPRTLFAASNPSLQVLPEAQKGIIDLRDWDWEQNGVISLDGEWEFYWQELLIPQDFQRMGSLGEKNLIIVPSSWNKYEVVGKESTGKGYATYRLVLHTPKDQVLGLKLPRIFTSYNLYVNGQLLAANGHVASNSDQVPQYLPQVKTFYTDTETTEIIIQVANYRHRSGGILERILLGPADQINHLRNANIARDLFLFGSLFIIGFYNLALFIFRTKDKSHFYFAIYSLLIAFRTLLVGEIYFINLFPHFSWEIAHKIQTLAYYLGVPLLFMFLKSIFPKDILPKLNWLIVIVGLGFSALVLLTSARIFTNFNPFYQVFTLAVVPAYILYIVIRAGLKKREGAYLVGLGVGSFILTGVNDIIYLSVAFNDSSIHFLRNIVTRGNLSSWGLLVLVFTQALVLAKKFSKTFNKVELVSEELQQLNEHLEEKVIERTLALETSKKELETAYEAVKRLEKSRQHLVQNISHDLRTPLTSIQGYTSAILDGVVKDPEQEHRYLKRVIERVSAINHLVEQLLELSRLETRQLHLNFRSMPLKLYLKSLSEKYILDFKASRISFRINNSITENVEDYEAEQLWVRTDTQQIERVFENLFSNAKKYTGTDGEIALNFDLSEDKRVLLVEVVDTGIGISPADLEHIFERFYMAAKPRQIASKSSGLGLAIVKEIIEYHGGRIWAESIQGKGSHFFFTLPIYQPSNEDASTQSS